jgi:hypothetical protein
MRVKADLNHIRNLESYEAFTCIEEGTGYDTASIKIERSKNGKPVYDWKRNTQPLNFDQEKFLLKKGELKSDEAWLNLCDFLTGDFIISKSGSVYWNEFRRKWVMIFEQIYGTSFLGELWYAEGDTPTGPWIYARKIVTHDNYTFYNVGQHPLFDQDEGRLIYFEGTYTNAFTDNQSQTPRYDYNQIMYRLDLNDPRLYLPSPVYMISDKKTKSRYMMRDETDSLNQWKQIQKIPFFALPPGRKIEGSVPVCAVRQKGKTRLQVKTPDQPAEPLFYGLQQLSSTMLVPLYEFKDKDGFYFYSTENELEGLKRSEKPVCLVWKNPSSLLNLDFEAKPVPLR